MYQKQANRSTDMVDRAVDQLNLLPGVKGKWKQRGPELTDGVVELTAGNQHLRLYTEAKTMLRQHQVPHLLKLHERFKPLIAIAEYIEPLAKETLRQEGINYLETNGNVFLKEGGVLLWVDGRKPVAREKEKTGRAFTKTGLRLLFHFLIDQQLVNKKYRDLAAITGVGFGNINFIITSLKEQGFLIPLNDKTFKLNNKNELLNKWIAAYAEKLKPDLRMDQFRFYDTQQELNWKTVDLPPLTCWGGEPAGNILTNHLNPEKFTLYTGLRRPDIMKNMKIIPAKQGTIEVYQRFWNAVYDVKNCAPALLVYADLINNGDRRSRETAQKIYDENLQHQFA